jgi:hypothetical protein
MSEVVARHFVTKCQGLGIRGLWIEDCKDGRRIEVDGPPQSQSGEDRRTAVLASIDDVNDFVVKPANTVNGPKWFIRIDVPGIDPQVIYDNDPLAVLERAEAMGFLKYAVKYEQPQEPAAPVRNPNGWRRRPGDVYDK